MSKVVTLRKSGNSLIFTAPSDMQNEIGTKYEMKKGSNGSVIYEPITHKNIFSDPEWQNYNYQEAMDNDPELSVPKPMGKENIVE